MPPTRRWRRVALGVVPVVVVTACSSDSPSTLAPAGPRSGLVAALWWTLFAVSLVVSVVVIAMMLWAALFRRRAETPVKPHSGQRLVLVLGVAVPAVILVGTFGLSVGGIAGGADPPTPARLSVEVIGHRWWWEVRYPGAGVVTANEIHVPAGTPVELRLSTADVIHSFWVPELMPKIDLIPRRVNETWFSADRPGTYRGQCAEFCGLQHGHMAFSVVAQPTANFRSWLDRQRRAAAEPDTLAERRGRTVFETSTCATCHTIRGTSAHGGLGPDLTHVGGRDRLAAGAVPNTFGYMSGWVSNSQSVKPGNLMPPQQLTPDELRAVVTYLQSLE